MKKEQKHFEVSYNDFQLKVTCISKEWEAKYIPMSIPTLIGYGGENAIHILLGGMQSHRTDVVVIDQPIDSPLEVLLHIELPDSEVASAIEACLNEREQRAERSRNALELKKRALKRKLNVGDEVTFHYTTKHLYCFDDEMKMQDGKTAVLVEADLQPGC